MNQTLTLWASSGYGGKTRKPFVSIHWKDVVGQLSPEAARQFALSLIGAAEAAEQDAFVFECGKGSIGASDEGAAVLLREFRKWREKRKETAS